MQFEIKTNKREEIVDITDRVRKIVKENADKSKTCLVYVPHATAAIIVNENYDEKVCNDILTYLRQSIPEGKWEHDKIDNNADSHIKSSIIGPGQVIPMKDGKLQLGRWQGIALAEFDGPRKRKVIVKVL